MSGQSNNPDPECDVEELSTDLELQFSFKPYKFLCDRMDRSVHRHIPTSSRKLSRSVDECYCSEGLWFLNGLSNKFIEV